MKTTKATAKMTYNASDYPELWRFDCIESRLLATSDEDYNKSVVCAVVEDLYYRKRQRKNIGLLLSQTNQKPNGNSRVYDIVCK
jgi:hypothetical protein